MAKNGLGVKHGAGWDNAWNEGEHMSNPTSGLPRLGTSRAWPYGLEDFGRRSRVDYQDVTMWRARGPFISHPLNRSPEEVS